MKYQSLAILAGSVCWLLQQIYQFSLLGVTGLLTLFAAAAGYALFAEDIYKKRHVDKIAVLKDAAVLLLYFGLGYLPLELFRRLLFHPLAVYPGPLAAKISRFWYSSFLISGQTPFAIRDLHIRHGDIVRIAPDEVSINNAEWIEKVLGTEAALRKGYDYLGLFHADNLQLQGIQDFETHAVRRKYWDHGFVDDKLDAWQLVSVKHANALVKALEKKAATGTPFDIGQYCSWFASDQDSELAYGQSVNQMTEGKADFISGLAFKALVIAAQKAWVEPLTKLVPSFHKLYTLTTERLAHGPKDDLFGAIIGESQPHLNNLTFAQQAAEARTILLAGSPTVGNVFAFALQFLIQNGMFDRLAYEVKGVGLSDRKALAEMPFLNAAIDETLRLRPLVPSRTQRIVSENGLVLPDGKKAPKGIFVGLPFYTVQRDARYFSQPEEFRPDRWIYPEKEERFDRKAYFPFSYGPYNCVGGPLALGQLRVGLAALAQNFEIHFSPAYNAIKYEKAIIDQFTLQMGELSVVVGKR